MQLKRRIIKIIHRLKRNACQYSIISIDRFSGERRLLCRTCERVDKVFYVN